MPDRQPTRLISPGTWPEAQRISALLRRETVGGFVIMGAALLGLIAANVGGFYENWREFSIGPESLHLNLSLGKWAADGLLAIFFFLVGLELKHEFVAGDLRDPRRAAVPMVAAVGGMAAPAAIYLALNWGNSDAVGGWAIPTATDIAFAVAVLAVLGSHLPGSLRTFLLTLAIVDDLLAIIIIAVVYTSELHLLYFALALIPIAIFGFLAQKRITYWWLLMPLAFVAWALVHASGIHATIAGVLLGFTVPVITAKGEEGHSVGHRLEHVVRPWSSAVAVPIFAFFSAGVAINSTVVREAAVDPITLGIIGGLVLGKPLGIIGATWLMDTFTSADLSDDLSWWDMLGLAFLAGIGFTVSLLIGELAFGPGSESDEHVKIGVLVGSLTAALLATVVLRQREKIYRVMAIEAERDDDLDGIPDIYQRKD